MKNLFSTIFVLLIFSCSPLKVNEVDYTKITKEKFLEKPFGFEETIKNFTEQQPKFKAQKLLRKNNHYPEKTDTIYRFHYRKSEVFFYKTYTNKEFLLAGKIKDKQIELVNNIQVGISKTSFIDRFSDKLKFTGDSLQMISEGTKYTFIFKKDKLTRINIDNYFD